MRWLFSPFPTYIFGDKKVSKGPRSASPFLPSLSTLVPYTTPIPTPIFQSTIFSTHTQSVHACHTWLHSLPLPSGVFFSRSRLWLRERLWGFGGWVFFECVGFFLPAGFACGFVRERQRERVCVCVLEKKRENNQSSPNPHCAKIKSQMNEK